MLRGSGKQLIFENDDDRLRMLGMLRKNLKKHACEIHAWCLMSNHVHMVVRDPHGNLSDLMHAVGTAYARYFNERTGRVGHVFQDRFRSIPIADERQLLATVRYIHENPRELGADPQTYRWSSYREYLGDEGLAITAVVLEASGGRFALDGPLDNEAQSRYEPITGRDMTDEAVMRAANWLLSPVKASELKAMPPKRRNGALSRLREAGISIRQIARITGIGESTISRATSQTKRTPKSCA